MPILQHYLITIPLQGGYMHGYVMAKDKRVLMDVSETLIKKAEDLGFEMWPPMILQTHLTTGWKLVREIITNCCGNHVDELYEKWKTVEDFHLTAWAMAENHPDRKRLMDLH